MTIEEAVALLHDAREWLGHGLPCATVCGECIVIARIDDALAAHDAREAHFRRERDDAVLAAIVARGG